MNTGMANLSLNDFQPQIPTHLSPPTSFSDRQVGLNPTDQIGSSTSNLSPYNSAVQPGSHFNSSLARRMNEPDMVNLFSPPTETRPSNGNNPNRPPPPPASTSPFNFQPLLSVGPNSNLNTHDGSVHHTNINSFNENNNTLRDSFNDNSLVDSTGKHSADDHSYRVDEEPSLEETDEQIPIAAESTVGSSGKKKKDKRFRFFGGK